MADTNYTVTSHAMSYHNPAFHCIGLWWFRTWTRLHGIRRSGPPWRESRFPNHTQYAEKQDVQMKDYAPTTTKKNNFFVYRSQDVIRKGITNGVCMPSMKVFFFPMVQKRRLKLTTDRQKQDICPRSLDAGHKKISILISVYKKMSVKLNKWDAYFASEMVWPLNKVTYRHWTYPASATDAHVVGAGGTRGSVRHYIPEHHREELVLWFTVKLARSICWKESHCNWCTYTSYWWLSRSWTGRLFRYEV